MRYILHAGSQAILASFNHHCAALRDYAFVATGIWGAAGGLRSDPPLKAGRPPSQAHRRVAAAAVYARIPTAADDSADSGQNRRLGEPHHCR